MSADMGKLAEHKAKNPEDAARIFTNSFLRPNKDKANMAKRMKNARDF
mgnify:CR=1 FL=1